MKNILESFPSDFNEFDLLGLWQTKDGRLAIITNLTEDGCLEGYVTRAGRTYNCLWDSDQLSIIPFRFVDDLAIKLENYTL